MIPRIFWQTRHSVPQFFDNPDIPSHICLFKFLWARMTKKQSSAAGVVLSATTMLPDWCTKLLDPCSDSSVNCEVSNKGFTNLAMGSRLQQVPKYLNYLKLRFVGTDPNCVISLPDRILTMSFISTDVTLFSYIAIIRNSLTLYVICFHDLLLHYNFSGMSTRKIYDIPLRLKLAVRSYLGF